ncbi:unnamed protein product [Notodromas monacha]|uniref:Uncharacterized protein n=1 Tax=Notodromas monacha TaxID=399045 RepID=A0A7R9GAY0_9CRUS|nr:unnamed protein product [Notodromas monacha]CAG0914465.1 unnamed protein product [Notodromas monacha]
MNHVPLTQPETEVRIYHGAPPRTLVTTVEAFPENQSSHRPDYRIYEGKDHEYFSIDSETGKITTTRTIERKPTSSYVIIVIAYSDGKTEVFKLKVTVVEKNQFPPRFSRDVYMVEVLANAPENTTIAECVAVDPDRHAGVGDVTYTLMAPPGDGGVESTEFLRIDPKTGAVVVVVRPLPLVPAPLRLSVIATDGGVPELASVAELVVHVKTISETPPRETRQFQGAVIENLAVASPCDRGGGIRAAAPLRVADFLRGHAGAWHQLLPGNWDFSGRLFRCARKHANIRGLIKGCNLGRWSASNVSIFRGQVAGMMKYCEAPLGADRNARVGLPERVEVRATTNSTATVCWDTPLIGLVTGFLLQYEEMSSDLEPAREVAVSGAQAAPGSPVCGTLSRLRTRADFRVRVAGRNDRDVGIFSEPVEFHTRQDDCENSECVHGKCVPATGDSGGYTCDCEEGFFGTFCEEEDECFSNPCENFGVCRVQDKRRTCTCLAGFYGPNCSLFNPCSSQPGPCKNGANCVSEHSHEYECKCLVGFFGKICEKVDPCASGPCFNDGRCMNVSETAYMCSCPPGFTGPLCQWETDECASSPCQNGGSCIDHRNAFECRCSPGFTGIRCEIDIDECGSSPCQNGATCVQGVNKYECRCPHGYGGHFCEMRDRCDSDVSDTTWGSLSWPSTPQGEALFLPCPFGPADDDGGDVGGGGGSDNDVVRRWGRRVAAPAVLAQARRTCFLTPLGSHWGPVVGSDCRTKASVEVEQEAQDLVEKTQPSPGKVLTARFLEETAEKIRGVLSFALEDDKAIQVAQNMFAAISNLVASGTSGNWTQAVLSVVDAYASNVSLGDGGMVAVRTENVIVEARRMPSLVMPDFNQSVQFVVERPAAEGSARQREASFIVASIEVPPEALKQAQAESSDRLRIQFVGFANGLLFGSAAKNETDAEARNARVISATIRGHPVQNLTAPVKIIIPTPYPRRSSATYRCVFWDEKDMKWSTEGVNTSFATVAKVGCESTHLTSFSLLLDLTPETESSLSPGHQMALTVIGFIGSTLSLISLIITIVTYSIFRTLRQDLAGKILLNLCVSLLVMNLSFVVSSMSQHFDNASVCWMTAVLLHYFVLSSLLWMFVEALHMHQLLITVFTSSETHILLKRMLLAWGIPFLIVGITACAGSSFYISDRQDFCSISARNPYVYYVTYVVPACLIVLMNMAVFCMVCRVICSRRMVTGKVGGLPSSVSMAQVRGVLAVMALLGVTWIFGAMSFGPGKLVFHYAFSLTNAFQGFVIFVIRCLQYPEARQCWLHLLATGKIKTYRGPSNAKGRATRSNATHTTTSVVDGGDFPSESYTDGVRKIRDRVMNAFRAPKRGNAEDADDPPQKPTRTHIDATKNSWNASPTIQTNVSTIAKQVESIYETINSCPESKPEDHDESTMETRPKRTLLSARPSFSTSKLKDYKEGSITSWQFLKPSAQKEPISISTHYRTEVARGRTKPDRRFHTCSGVPKAVKQQASERNNLTVRLDETKKSRGVLLLHGQLVWSTAKQNESALEDKISDARANSAKTHATIMRVTGMRSAGEYKTRGSRTSRATLSIMTSGRAFLWFALVLLGATAAPAAASVFDELRADLARSVDVDGVSATSVKSKLADFREAYRKYLASLSGAPTTIEYRKVLIMVPNDVVTRPLRRHLDGEIAGISFPIKKYATEEREWSVYSAALTIKGDAELPRRLRFYLPGPRFTLVGKTWLHHGRATVDMTPIVSEWFNHRSSMHVLVQCAACLPGELVANSTYVEVVLKKQGIKTVAPARAKRSLAEKRRREAPSLPPCESGEHTDQCCRRNMTVDLRWMPGFHFLPNPLLFNAYVCAGECAPKNSHPIRHALHKELQYENAEDPEESTSCCSPTKFEPLRVFYHDIEGRQHTKTWDNVVVAECGGS